LLDITKELFINAQDVAVAGALEDAEKVILQIKWLWLQL
jgi:hypothetical protein